MEFLYSDEPIIACSTSQQGNAAMAVIRISGFSSIQALKSFFSLDLSRINPRQVYYTKLLSGDQTLDDVCMTYFEGPRSYNGENILEISAHGNTLNVERIIDLFVAGKVCRPAQPGEFTYRALKNKKLTLSQVEGLDLFLNANSGYALDQGLSLLSGNLHDLYQELWDAFLKHKASLELSIDFSEDIGEEVARREYLDSLTNLSEKIEKLFRRSAPLSANLLQPEIVIAGLPNAGKSSFFNLLLRENRAIVSEVAGTTRDYLSESLLIEGVRYKLIDTAGIREAKDLIESEGIKRSHQKLHDSFYSVLLINPFEMLSGIDELLGLQFDLIFFTHADVAGFTEARAALVKKYPQLGSIGALNLTTPGPWEQNLFTCINNKYCSVTHQQPLLLDRHKYLISRSHRLIRDYSSLALSETDVAILSGELNAMGHCISELIGIVSPDQVLNSIFSNFCIGK